jgi:hypothetical protein
MDDQIADFISITGASSDEALQYLEMANYDSELAANLYWDMGNNPVPTRSSNPIPLDDSDEVRRPIESRVDRLIQNPSQLFHEPSEHSDSEYLFAPPLSTASSGVSLQAVITRAKQANKFVLVSIQDPEVFASHVLNRDVWPNEILSEIISQNFEFYLRDKNSTDGRSFASNYRLEKFPVVGILDSRTGRLLKKFEKIPDASFLIEQLTVFLDKLPVMPPSSSSSAHAAIEIPSSPPSVQRPPVSATPAAATPTAPASAQMPELPAAGTAGTVRVAMRLSSGTREQITVFPDTQIRVLVQWASAREQLAIESIDLKTAPPQVKSVKNDFDQNATVETAGLAGALLTIVKLN